MTDGPDIAVMREDVHGIPIEAYADELRDRLPDHDIRVATTPAEERELLRTAAVATGIDIDGTMVGGAENLRLFACAYAGYGHLPVEALREQGIAVTTASGVHGTNMAEYTVGVILASAYRFPEAWRRKERREWRHYKNREVAGSTITIVGLGAIGSAVVDHLAGFDVTTIGIRRHPEEGGPADQVVGPDRLHDALSRTDYLVLACPLTEETRGLIGGDEFATLPPTAVVVNVARGPVVETDALVDAIQMNAIRGAALDVTDPEPLPEDHPLWGFGNVQITPHNSGHTPEYYARLADIVAENLRRVDETGEYRNLQNQVISPDG